MTVNGTKPEEEPFDDIVTHGPMGKEEGSTTITTKKELKLKTEQEKGGRNVVDFVVHRISG